MSDESEIKIVKKYYFKCSETSLPEELISTLLIIEKALKEVKIGSYKSSYEASRKKKLFSPVDLNNQIKSVLNSVGLKSERIICSYKDIDPELQDDIDSISNMYLEVDKTVPFAKNYFTQIYDKLLEELINSDMSLRKPSDAWKRLTKGYDSHDDERHDQLIIKIKNKYQFKNDISGIDLIPYLTKDFVGFREIDFVKRFEPSGKSVGVEVQFGKYAFMVYNVCAKMKIFQKKGIIDFGIEIVPTKNMQKNMSTGVSFFEQFVWDLENRGSFQEDVPVIVLAVEPNRHGFDALSKDGLKEVSIKKYGSPAS